MLINGLTISGRYSCLRSQFSNDLDGKGEEQSIINYPTTQIRLIPALCDAFAIRFAGINLGIRSTNMSVCLFSFNI